MLRFGLMAFLHLILLKPHDEIFFFNTKPRSDDTARFISVFFIRSRVYD